MSKDQARVVSITVRKSHEVADVATQRDLESTHKDLTPQIAEVKYYLAKILKDLSVDISLRFERTDAQIANSCKKSTARADRMDAEISGERKYMISLFEKREAKIALVRNDMEALTNSLPIKLTKIILGMVEFASAIVTIVVKFFSFLQL
ncbi:MAG TPA: DUF1640 domain-containing protein [Arsenophonus apicola]